MLREFGYDVHDHCRRAVDVLIRIGLLEEAEKTVAASRNLIDLLRQINGKDFLLTGQTESV